MAVNLDLFKSLEAVSLPAISRVLTNSRNTAAPVAAADATVTPSAATTVNNSQTGAVLPRHPQ